MKPSFRKIDTSVSLDRRSSWLRFTTDGSLSINLGRSTDFLVPVSRCSLSVHGITVATSIAAL